MLKIGGKNHLKESYLLIILFELEADYKCCHALMSVAGWGS